MMYLLVGLGNPGEKFIHTRHNIGREMLEAWHKSSDMAAISDMPKLCARVSKNKKALLALPETFMNDSGKAAGATARFFKIKPEQIIIIHDDADIELGRTKLSFNRAAAGHKGVESVRKALKTEKFWRLRIGIQKKKRVDAMKLVLQKFTPAEELLLKRLKKKIFAGLDLLLTRGPERAMNEINRN